MEAISQTKLDLWMAEARDDNWLAQVIGCTRSQASRIRRGKSCPSLAAAVAIEIATNGEVSAADLLVASSSPHDDGSPLASATTAVLVSEPVPAQ